MESMTAPCTVPKSPVRRIGVSHSVGFWVIALVFLTEMAFCAVPTPLYAIYQQRDGFPTFVVTVVFAAYAFGVMLSLYVAGHASDWLGRRRVILASVLISLISATLFLLWNDVAGLIVARFINGLGVGVLTATATAHLAELGTTARQPATRSIVVSTFANLGGIALGPLVAGAIATWSARPLTVPYLLFVLLFVLEFVLVALVPETAEIDDVRRSYRPQRLAIPSTSRGAYVAAVAGAFGSFAVFGTFTSLSSTFLVGILGNHSHLLAGIAPFFVFMAAAVAQVIGTYVPVRQQVLVSNVAAVVGFATLAVGVVFASLSAFLLGAALAGAGVGILFRRSLTVVADIAPASRRGEALAGLFLIAYAGMTIPPLLCGAALMLWSETPVFLVLSALVAPLVIASGVRLKLC